MMSQLKRIEFRSVSFSYESGSESTEVLKGVSFSLEPGQIKALLGKNGSGKSTISQLATGLLLPTVGRVTVNQIDTADCNPEVQRLVGILFQNPDTQIVGTTVEEDLAFGLENMAVSQLEIRQRIDETACQFEFTEILSTPTWQLSGGMKQKLALAGVMITRPDFLILDEPTSHLDPWSAEEFWEVINRLKMENNLGILVVSQRPCDFEHLEQIIVLDQGSIAFDGPSCKLWSLPECLKWGICPPESNRLKHLLNTRD